MGISLFDVATSTATLIDSINDSGYIGIFIEKSEGKMRLFYNKSDLGDKRRTLIMFEIPIK